MTRKIKSITVAHEQNIYTHESKTIVTVHFDAKGFNAYGTRTILHHADGSQEKHNDNLSAAELAEAKKLAFSDGKWHDVRDQAYEEKLQRQLNALSAQRHAVRQSSEDELNAERGFQQPVTFSGTIDANS